MSAHVRLSDLGLALEIIEAEFQCLQVCFNACELQPDKEVPWLATGVWRTDGTVQNPPALVEPQNIVSDKVEVYRKVAETCSVLVFSILKPAGSSTAIISPPTDEGKKESYYQHLTIIWIDLINEKLEVIRKSLKAYIEKKCS